MFGEPALIAGLCLTKRGPKAVVLKAALRAGSGRMVVGGSTVEGVELLAGGRVLAAASGW